MKRLDLVGQRFGRLTVISLNEEISKQKKNTYWNCKCDCGNEKVVFGKSLRCGGTTSCGCYRKDKMREVVKELWQDEEFKQMRSETSSKWLKEKWQDEEFKQLRSDKAREQMKESVGEDSHNYKGGISLISDHLRRLQVVSQWKKDTYARENNRCQLTHKKVHGGNSDVHHLYGFNMIVLEAHKLHNIQVKPQVKDYTREELHKLEEYVTSWHKDTSNAVLLCEEVHNLFHKAKDKGGYGHGNNTPEQFEEFRGRYMAGEFKDLI